MLYSCCAVAAVLFSSGIAFSQNKSWRMASQLSVELEQEWIRYQETLPEYATNSFAKVSNQNLCVGGVKVGEFFFGGMRAVFPVAVSHDDERWDIEDFPDQYNRLKIEWIRIGGFAGAAFGPLFNPYIGLLWSDVLQTRSDFHNDYFRLSNDIVEERITATYFVLGLRGGWRFARSFDVQYDADLLRPVDMKVSNSKYPGWGPSDIRGYGFDLGVRFRYEIGSGYWIGSAFKGGHIFWKGSDGSGGVKWPENKTETYSVAVSFDKSF